MTETPAERTPDGGAEAEQVTSGEPTRSDPAGMRAAAEQPRPDLDERQSRVASERKPMGPPLERTSSLAEEAPREEDVDPTDPSEPEGER